MFLNAAKSSGWSAKTNCALFYGLLIWIKSARKITKKNAGGKFAYSSKIRQICTKLHI